MTASSGAPRHVTVERDGPVGIVVLDRPDRRNAYTPHMAVQLGAALVDLDRDDSIRVAVVTGRGEHFSVGADLDIDWRDPSVHGAEDLSDPSTAPWNLATPIIGAINGDAIGVALTWAMQWDIRFVAEDARIAFSFNRVGIMPDRNSLWLLPRLVGLSTAMDLLLTGRTIDGAEAHRIGLVSRALAAGDVLDAAVAAAHDIAANCAPVSTTATKRLMYEFLGETDRIHAYNHERRVLNWVRTQGETLRGITAFKERRAPEWGTTKSTVIPPELK
ncbi:enoyl-CoA hydratase/isomerase family protein [Desertimonas flava]|uniref:enoyl-CoA hydratase/isomerase family protein n=1 Tax=Desertimonas flava TaxID=2064846 RepID=UPI0013C4B333|nr:enoyl-CoA hydratase-related protein [Desertimonas flava]